MAYWRLRRPMVLSSLTIKAGQNKANQPHKQGKSGKMGRKRENCEGNGKLVRSLPLRIERAGYGPGQNYINIFTGYPRERTGCTTYGLNSDSAYD